MGLKEGLKFCATDKIFWLFWDVLGPCTDLIFEIFKLVSAKQTDFKDNNYFGYRMQT